MGNSPAPFGLDRSLLRLDGQDLYLCLHFAMIFVRDQSEACVSILTSLVSGW
jgi:hypothetical protein